MQQVIFHFILKKKHNYPEYKVTEYSKLFNVEYFEMHFDSSQKQDVRKKTPDNFTKYKRLIVLKTFPVPI